jgi:thymidylate kinase
MTIRLAVASRPVIVVLEGQDFAGKSTVARLVLDALRERGVPVRGSTTTALAVGVLDRAVLRLYTASRVPDRLRTFLYLVLFGLDLLPRPGRAQRRVVLQESYVDRTVAHALACRYALSAVLGCWVSDRCHRRVAAAVLLAVPYEVRRGRWAALGSDDPRDRERFHPACQRRQRALERLLEQQTARHGYIVVRGNPQPETVARLLVDLVLTHAGGTQ